MPDLPPTVGRIGLGIAAVFAVGVAALALRPPDVDGQVQALDFVRVAATPERTVVWSGPRTCQARAVDSGRLAVREAGRWEVLRTPLPNVRAMAALEDRIVIAGRDAACRWQVLSSSDGGLAWTGVPYRSGVAGDDDAVADVAVAPDGDTWVLLRSSPDASVLLVGPESRSSSEPRAVPFGCLEAQQLTHVATATGPRVWTICQDDPGLSRLLSRSPDLGAFIERAADERPESGLGRPGAVRALSFSAAPVGWLVKDSFLCAEGELLRTEDGGRRWGQVPCLGGTTFLGEVLDVVGVSGRRAVVGGLRGGQPYAYVTEDAGRSWQQEAPPRVLRGGAS